MKMVKPEILAPAGSYEIMIQAFQAGADAVYLGGTQFGARAFAANLTETELLHGIEYAQLHHKKLYLTVNTLLKDEEIDRLFAYLKAPYEAGLDAVIVQDLGVAAIVHECFPEMELHASTQMALTSGYGAELLKQLGAVRIVPARELSLEELRRIKQQTGMEIEVFVHGALCYSYSGHCLLSSMIGGRSGNRGRCAQPCRQLYSLPNGEQAYFLSPKDLCGLAAVPELIEAGMDSFKIEGRMKKPEYVISAVDAYRRAVDAYFEGQAFRAEAEREQLADIFNRGQFTEGYFHQHNGKGMMALERNHHDGVRVGIIVGIQGGKLRIRLERELHQGDVLEIRTKAGAEIELTSGQNGESGTEVELNGKQIKLIHKGDLVYRTKNHQLCERFLKENEARGLKEKIHISVTLKKDLSAMIKAECGACSATVTGSMVTKAQKQPLEQQVILDKLYKLGDAPFIIEDVILDMDEDAFFSMKEFNLLRRQVIADLERVCSTNCQRKAIEPQSISLAKTMDVQVSSLAATTDKTVDVQKRSLMEPMDKAMHKTLAVEGNKSGEKTFVSVGVSTSQQLETVLNHPFVKRIELEAECFSTETIRAALLQIRQSMKAGFISLPRMYRADMEAEFLEYLSMKPDGLVVRTMDELAFVRQNCPDIQVVCDYSVYAYNAIAANQYPKLIQNVHMTLPVELNQGELETLLDKTPAVNWEWILYGRQPVMVTVQCTAQNSRGCQKKAGEERLKNGFQDSFRVHRVCKHCYNVIYQEQPTCLIGFQQELEPDRIGVYRILFTTETALEVERVLTFSSNSNGYYGHYRKGIE